jgi:hypothetical protein
VGHFKLRISPRHCFFFVLVYLLPNLRASKQTIKQPQTERSRNTGQTALMKQRSWLPSKSRDSLFGPSSSKKRLVLPHHPHAWVAPINIPFQIKDVIISFSIYIYRTRRNNNLCWFATLHIYTAYTCHRRN